MLILIIIYVIIHLNQILIKNIHVQFHLINLMLLIYVIINVNLKI